MSKLPNELINLIMSYMPPSRVNWFVKRRIRQYTHNKIRGIDRDTYVEYNGDLSFAHRYFFSRYINKNPSTKSKYHEMDVEEYFSNSKIYNYSNMDSDYVDTLNEYNKNH